MKVLKKVKTGFDAVLEFIEVNMSALLFLVVLLGFVTTIVFRYILMLSIAQIDELIVISFTWMAMFASPFGTKNDEHVSFTVIYDSMGPRFKAVNDVLWKVILLVLLIILVGPAWETVTFFKIRSTPMLHFRFDWLYMPYMFFLIFTIYHLLNNLVRDIKIMVETFKTKKVEG